MKKLAVLFSAFLLTLSLAGCGDQSSTNQTENHTEVAGKVTLDGSTSMEKLVKGLSEAITEDYPQLTLEAQFTGSGTGIKSAIAGKVDIADASRALKDEEKAEGLVENIVAIDGIAIIVDNGNTVTDLTKQQLTDIYTGKIKNWKEVGGQDQNIVVIGREEGSGTRDGFESILDIEGVCNYANTLNETGSVVAKVQKTPGAIGYVSLDIVQNNDAVKTVSLEGITPNADTIVSGAYILQRPFVMGTMGPIEEQREQVQAVFKFLDSDHGKVVIEKVGLVAPSK